MLGDLLRDFVTLEDVLERGDLEPELIGHPKKHQDLVGAVAMRVDQSLPAQNLCESFQLQIFCGRYGWLVCRQGSFLVLVPLLGIGTCFNQGVTYHVFNPHSSLAVGARASAWTSRRPLGIRLWDRLA